ncbi:hypothetical protein EVAR_85159_1 [Eumeta japonica]|uniref:DDE-1 domain-containing protein n=1 Tax=Eumeta variegata TaxID=151549 RepID=A0A4C2A051_EUMVA|nr:hypothetical protein EVAR_85159_1 [Eumeta japonica]
MPMKLALFGKHYKTTLASKGNLVPWTCPGHNPGHKVRKSRNPEHLKRKNFHSSQSQPKAWMTAALFTEWYDEVFIPEVKSTKIGGKRRHVREDVEEELSADVEVDAGPSASEALPASRLL